jgi:N-methylhydantoinase A
MSSTVADAFLKPIVHSAVDSFTEALDESNMGGLQDRFLMMKSNGGVMHYTASVKRPIDLTVSGPVGGVLSSVYFGNLINRQNLITMDMGGTSFDVSMINRGEVSQTTELELEWGIPIKTSLVNVETIGAGGGSIAWIDKGGLLRVGPQSAGAFPGPACYERGGKEPTVTDANLFMGRLNPLSFAGGKMVLNVDASRNVLQKIGSELDADLNSVARMIIELVDSNMANALRIVSIDKGLDPRDFTLVAFGGAGPLHAASLARIIGMTEVLVPIYPGVFSAFGLTTADMKVDQSQTANMRSDHLDLKIVNRIIQDLQRRAVKEIEMEGYTKEPSIKYEIEMRYLGQNYNIDVQIPLDNKGLLTEDGMIEVYRRFHTLHKTLYGYSIEDEIIEFVNYKVIATGKIKEPSIASLPVKDTKVKPKEFRQVYFIEKDNFMKTPIYDRQDFGAKTQITGPAIIEEGTSTTLLLPDQNLKVDKYGNMFIKEG